MLLLLWKLMSFLSDDIICYMFFCAYSHTCFGENVVCYMWFMKIIVAGNIYIPLLD